MGGRAAACQVYPDKLCKAMLKDIRLELMNSGIIQASKNDMMAMSAGNWVPEMIQMVGATDALGADGGKSHWIDWADVAAADPDFVILIPCGFELERVLTEAKTPAVWAHLKNLRATREGNLFGVDGHHLFNRPGPRLIDSLEVLAEIIHPESFQFKATTQFAKRIEP